MRGTKISILAVLADRDTMSAIQELAPYIISILAVLADRDIDQQDDHAHDAISILAVLADRDRR